MNYICAVSPDFPENYRIGVEAGLWGVEEKYKRFIEPVRRGDLLIFSVGGVVRSIHRIETAPFYDAIPLWPMKDGSVFPYRVRISAPLHTGAADFRSFSEHISFMRGKLWSGTIQGPNGVFNSKATDSDVALIQSLLVPVQEPLRYIERRGRQKKLAEPGRGAVLCLDEARLRGCVGELVRAEGLQPSALDGRVRSELPPGPGLVTSLFDSARRDFMVVDLHVQRPGEQALLSILKRMSWVRQHAERPRDVRGLLLLDRPDHDLHAVAGEVPNLQVREYDVRLALTS